MTRHQIPLDPARFFTTDPVYGALSDSNGDGVPDDVVARLMIAGEPDPREWIALIHLAARLGLETTALSLPLAFAAGSAPATARPLHFVPAGTSTAPAEGWTVQGAAAVDALWQYGFTASTPLAAEQPVAPERADFDLAKIYSLSGVLVDDDGDHFPDRIRLRIEAPERLPVIVGLALLDLAARLGLETTGITFPLATPAGTPRQHDTIPLVLDIAPETGGRGDCAVERHEEGWLLRVTGDGAGVAQTLRTLATTWPAAPTGDTERSMLTDFTDQLKRSLRGEDAAGRAALLSADLALIDPATAPAGELRLLTDEPAVRRAAETAIRDRGLPFTLTVAPEERLAFEETWTGEWEVDHTRRLIHERVLPALDRQRPAELTIALSESTAIREAVAREVLPLLPHGSIVRVRSAFKPGLCWLREEIAPAWAVRGDVARVEIRARTFVAPPEYQCLDLPIRWLQELYPADALLAEALGITTTDIALVLDDADAAMIYRVRAFDRTGVVVDEQTCSPRNRLQPYIASHPAEEWVSVTTGGIVLRQDGRVLVDAPVPTDYERFWDHYQTAILPRIAALIAQETKGAFSPADQPFFDSLEIEVWCSETDEALGLREERSSSAEALHQDLYFGTLDAIAALGSAPVSSGTLDNQPGEPLDAPGTIRPFVHLRPGEPPRARIALRRRLRDVAVLVSSAAAPLRIATLAQLPASRVTIERVICRVDLPEYVTPGLTITPSPRHDLLQHLARSSAAPSERIMVEIVQDDAPVTLALPLPEQPALDRRSVAVSEVYDQAPLTEELMRPHLARLATLPGIGIRQVGRSFAGRPIMAIEVTAAPGGAIWSRRKLSLHKPSLLVIARHHANEPASTPAALRLAELCATTSPYQELIRRVNIVILPLENPDGAALHGEMIAEHPHWKHHVARYNAVGREFARDYALPDSPFGEARARPRLWDEWLPDVVVDNHGVPSHEWNQHFNGFGSPPRFGVSYWIVQALVYGILRYPPDDPALAQIAALVRDRIAAAVAEDHEIVALNQIHRADYERWGHQWLPERFPASYHREMLWHCGPLSPTALARWRRPVGYTRVTVVELVTEVADETAHGHYLALVARAHLIANLALLSLLAERASPVTRVLEQRNGGSRISLHRSRHFPA